MSVESYGIRWEGHPDQLQIEMEMIRLGGVFTNRAGRRLGLGLFHHFRQMFSLCWPEDDHHRWSDMILEHILRNRLTVIAGARDCVAEHTRIPNPITGESPTIGELYESGKGTWVNTLYGPAPASAPFIKGHGPLYEVTLSNGERFTCSPKHFVLTSRGYVAVKSLVPGQAICSASPRFGRSIVEPCPSTRAADGPHCWRTAPSSPVGYPNDSCSCDAPLRRAKAAGQWSLPSPIGVPTRSQGNCSTGWIGIQTRTYPFLFTIRPPFHRGLYSPRKFQGS